MAAAGGVLATLLPVGVESEECFGAAADGAVFAGAVFAEEQAAIDRACEARRREFATVRRCARTCLERLGHPPAPILPGAGGAPDWPAGVRGSMTHCVGYAAAAIGRAREVRAVGIDAEPDLPLPDGVLAVVATPAEQARLARDHARSGSRNQDLPNQDRLLFSAKEAVYKVWFPLMGEWLDPQDTEILFEPEDASFTALLPGDGLALDGDRVTRLTGRWTRSRGVLLTAVTLPPR